MYKIVDRCEWVLVSGRQEVISGRWWKCLGGPGGVGGGHIDNKH